MIKTPTSDKSLVIRTDFTNETAWFKVCELMLKPHPKLGLTPYIEFINDKRLEKIDDNVLLNMIPENFNRSYFFVVDSRTFNSEEFLILCIDLQEIRGQKFRLTPESMWDVDLNLFIANANFEDYMLTLDSDNIYRTKA